MPRAAVRPIMSLPRIRPALLAAALLLAGCSDDETSLVVDGPALQPHPTEAGAWLGTFRIRNRTGETRTLERVESGDFGSAAFSAGEPLTIESGRELALSPVGRHLVLREPRGALRAGERSLLTLRFADGRVLRADAEVRRAAP